MGTLTRAIIACFVDTLLKTRSIFTPLSSSSTRPSFSAFSTLATSFLASRARRLRVADGFESASSSLPSDVSCESRWASAARRRCVASSEHLRQMQSVRSSMRV